MVTRLMLLIHPAAIAGLGWWRLSLLDVLKLKLAHRIPRDTICSTLLPYSQLRIHSSIYCMYPAMRLTITVMPPFATEV
ncbi:hypothetical protein BR93DRAFT_927951 [Coniochaeta sp. PMI_546]|nr:hypothetical protein BR93DRAFT_927951 [Coniochaeta sp. PMI_546]